MILLALVLLSNPGIADKHPHDRDIQKHPKVLFAESFEKGTLDQLSKRWDNAKGGLALVEGGPEKSKRCLQITATLGQDTGGHLYTRLKRPVETAYARFYVKFENDAGYVHHFVHMGGYFPATPWPQGGAGTRPRGDERFTAGIEPTGKWGRVNPPGHWNFYAYWHEMKRSPDGKYWGNSFEPKKPAVVPRGKWQCVEFMMKCNSPKEPDGELALWLDGRKTGRFKRISWRRSKDLKVNFFWLLHYVTEGALRRNRVKEPPKTNRVWFDSIVVATEYVGPIRAR